LIKGVTRATIADYTTLAAIFETTGQAAYDGAISYLYNDTLQQAAATIATVEARHSAVLNLLINALPFGNKTSPLDDSLSPKTVTALITPIVGEACLANLTLPKVKLVLPTATNKLHSTPSLTNPSQKDLDANDIKVLQFALTLEHLEANFYSKFQGKFRDNNFARANYSGVRNYFNLIRAHEKAHVFFLSNVISSFGYFPVKRCSYNFTGIKTVQAYIEMASLLESTGVSAYDGAVSAIYDKGIKEAAATIATVEGRHASFLKVLLGNSTNNGTDVFPSSAFDTALTPSAIVALVTPLIKKCPRNQTIELPLYLTVPIKST